MTNDCLRRFCHHGGILKVTNFSAVRSQLAQASITAFHLRLMDRIRCLTAVTRVY